MDNPKWCYIQCTKRQESKELVAKIKVFSLIENLMFVENAIRNLEGKKFESSKNLEQEVINQLDYINYAAASINKEFSNNYDLKIQL